MMGKTRLIDNGIAIIRGGRPARSGSKPARARRSSSGVASYGALLALMVFFGAGPPVAPAQIPPTSPAGQQASTTATETRGLEPRLKLSPNGRVRFIPEILSAEERQQLEKEKAPPAEPKRESPDMRVLREAAKLSSLSVDTSHVTSESLANHSELDQLLQEINGFSATPEPAPNQGASAQDGSITSETLFGAELTAELDALLRERFTSGTARTSDTLELLKEPEPPYVDLNAATISDLLEIEGVDVRRADAIVMYRHVHCGEKGFRSLDELTNVFGVTERIVDQWRPFLYVGKPDERARQRALEARVLRGM